MPKISLLLYVYNAQKLLPQCLNSLLKQKEKDFEVLIFDNASSDGTFPILKMYQKRDKRIKVFNSVEEENASMIKNNLLQKAKGEIVSFLPLAVFKEDFLYYVYRKINASGCDMLVVNDKNSFSPSYLSGIYESREERKILITHQLAQVENIFYSRNFLKKIKAKFCNEEFGSDFAFYIQTIANAEKIGYFNKSLLMTKASFGEFSNRELANYRQFAEVVKIGIKVLKKCNLWDDCEIHYIEALYGYLRIIIERLPYPVKNFFAKFIVETIANQVNPEKFDRKNYTMPVVADWFYQLKLKTYPSEKFEKCFYSKRDNITPIVLSAESDKNATFADVLMQSIKENANPQKFYDIYILTRGDIAKYITETIEKESTENIFINFVDLTKFISDNVYTYFYRTSSLYFFIPDILSQYNRATYLKNNVIVLKDITLLNTINMKDALIAGVKDNIDNEYIETELKLISETYINESVLIFNIPLCKKIKLSHKFLYEISAGTKIQQAQDILNIICFDKINVIDPEYNCNVDLLCGKRLIKNYPYKIDDVAILNYENNHPSSNYFREFADIWWKYARKSMFYETLMYVEKRIITNREYVLMKMYIKEAFLKILTIGKSALKHKEKMTDLQSLIAEERRL